MKVETPVTIACDAPLCPERFFTMALTVDRVEDIPDVRMRARAAAVELASSRGWFVRLDGRALCPLHARATVVLG